MHQQMRISLSPSHYNLIRIFISENAFLLFLSILWLLFLSIFRTGVIFEVSLDYKRSSSRWALAGCKGGSRRGLLFLHFGGTASSVSPTVVLALWGSVGFSVPAEQWTERLVPSPSSPCLLPQVLTRIIFPQLFWLKLARISEFPLLEPSVCPVGASPIAQLQWHWQVMFFLFPRSLPTKKM